MAEIKFNSSVVTGNNSPVKTLSDAQRIVAKCDACGCDDVLGYFTMLDVETGNVTPVYLDDGTLTVADLSIGTMAEWVTWLAEVCAWRAGGSVGDRPAEPAPE